MSGVETWWEHQIESINKVEDIASAVLNNPEQADLFHKFIEQKYGLESSEEVLNVTKNELSNLKAELWNIKEPENFEVLWKFVYEEVLEWQIANNIEKATSIDNIIDGFDSVRLTEMQKLFESYADQKFWKYEFLSPTQLNLLKLSIVDNFSSSSFFELAMNSGWDFQENIKWSLSLLNKWEYSNAVSQVQEWFSNFKESGDVLKWTLDNFLYPYELKLSEINTHIEVNGWELTKQEQKNIFSHIEIFNNPELLSKGLGTFDVSTIDFSKTEWKENPINTEKLKDFMVNSKEKIWELALQLNKWDEAQETLLGLMDNDMSWPVVQKLLSFALKIPIVWKMLAVFLWLDSNNPLDSLHSLTLQHSCHSTLLWMWQSKNKDWGNISGEWIFKNIDFWEQNFQSNKSSLSKILEITGVHNRDQVKQLWLDSFSKEWKEIDGLTLKFEWLDNADNFENWALKENQLSKILKSGIKKYEIQKENLLIEKEKEKEQEKINGEKEKIQKSVDKKQQELIAVWEWSVKLYQESEQISFIKNPENMKNIWEWDEWLNIWDVSDIEISQLVWWEHLEDLLHSTLWDEISKVSKDNLVHLGVLQNQLINYSKEHSFWDNVTTLNDLYSGVNSVSKDFFDFLWKEIDNKQSAIELNTQKQVDIVNELEKINVWVSSDMLLKQDLLELPEWDITSGIEYNAQGDIIQFHKDSQELQLWDSSFKVSNSVWFDFDQIQVLESWIQFKILWREILVSKIKVVEFLLTAKNSEENIQTLTAWDKSVTLERKV